MRPHARMFATLEKADRKKLDRQAIAHSTTPCFAAVGKFLPKFFRVSFTQSSSAQVLGRRVWACPVMRVCLDHGTRELSLMMLLLNMFS